jgi:hypothetical protein
MSAQELARFGVTFPREFVKRLDTAKGPYYSRNKFILKILEEHLNENEQEKSTQLSEGNRFPAQAPRAASSLDNSTRQVNTLDPNLQGYQASLSEERYQHGYAVLREGVRVMAASAL